MFTQHNSAAIVFWLFFKFGSETGYLKSYYVVYCLDESKSRRDMHCLREEFLQIKAGMGGNAGCFRDYS